MFKKKLFFTFCIAALSLNLFACSNKQEENKTTTHVAQKANPTNPDKQPDPNAPELVIVSVYIKNEDKTGLIKEIEAIEEKDANLLFLKLAEYSAISDDISLKSFKKEDKTASLDLNKIDKNNKLELASIVNTFIENYELDSINITINKKVDSELSNLKYIKNYKELK